MVLNPAAITATNNTIPAKDIFFFLKYYIWSKYVTLRKCCCSSQTYFKINFKHSHLVHWCT